MEPWDKTWAVHMCMHADISEIEVGFVMLISGNLRLGRSIEHFQTSRKRIVSKLVHWLISEILRWSFWKEHVGGQITRLCIFLWAAAAVRVAQNDLLKAPKAEETHKCSFYASVLALIVAVLCIYTHLLFN